MRRRNKKGSQMDTLSQDIKPKDFREESLKDLPFDVEKVRSMFREVRTVSDLTRPGGVLHEMLRSTIERLLEAEQEYYLGYPKHEKAETRRGNTRNGYSKKKLSTPSGDMEIRVPRDREGGFEPVLVRRHGKVDTTLRDQILGMYARGMSVRDIQSQLYTLYGVEMSPAFISAVTDHIMEAIYEWQNRPLESIYAVVYMDAIHYKVRENGKVVSKAAYTVLGIDLNGNTDVLGIWLGETEGAHFWLSVLDDLRRRGVEDILIACVDGLKGFPEAIEQVFPRARVQLCIVHQIRSSLKYVPSRNRSEFIKDLKQVYQAGTREMAEWALGNLESKWGTKYPYAVKSWRDNWLHLSTFFDFPEPIRKMIYTTNAIEALHRRFRKLTKAKASFPTDESLMKMLYLATFDSRQTNRRQKKNWAEVLGALQIIFGDRIKL
jgi:transposase-like protein